MPISVKQNVSDFDNKFVEAGSYLVGCLVFIQSLNMLDSIFRVPVEGLVSVAVLVVLEHQQVQTFLKYNDLYSSFSSFGCHSS